MSDTSWLDEKVRRDFDEAAENVHRAFCEPDHEMVGPWDRDMADALRRNGYALIRSPDSLDAAWVAAEAALPEGWVLDRLWDRLWDREVRAQWTARAVDGGLYTAFIESEPCLTPAAALRALAAKLRERTG
jgi:hypothetical protein